MNMESISIKESVQRLRNARKRGENVEQFDPILIGRDLDIVINALEKMHNADKKTIIFFERHWFIILWIQTLILTFAMWMFSL